MGEDMMVRQLCKRIIQISKQTKTYNGIKLSCSAASMQLDQVQGTAALEKTLRQTVGIMQNASLRSPLRSVASMTVKFDRLLDENNAKMEYMDDSLGSDGEEEEEEMIAQIMDELQIEARSLPAVPNARPAAKSSRVYEGVALALEERLQNLGKLGYSEMFGI